MNLEIIEHHQQWVLEAFRQGEFDQLEIIGEADEKEFLSCASGRRSCSSWPGRCPPPGRNRRCRCGLSWPAT
jgi:hypothetical protein